MGALEIPPSPDRVTRDWLTEALRSTGFLDPAGKVRSFGFTVLGEGKGFTGCVCRMDLEYVGQAASLPASIIAKFPPADVDVHAALHGYRIYEREHGFYHSGARTPGFRVPICYYGDVDLESGASILLLEDLDP